MKNLTPVSFLITFCAFLLIALTPACTTDLTDPNQIILEDERISTRADYSGLEEEVRVKVSERDNISQSSITSCYYWGPTSEGYGRYHLTTNLGFTMYTVTGIIGDDIEGW